MAVEGNPDRGTANRRPHPSPMGAAVIGSGNRDGPAVMGVNGRASTAVGDQTAVDRHSEHKGPRSPSERGPGRPSTVGRPDLPASLRGVASMMALSTIPIVRIETVSAAQATLSAPYRAVRPAARRTRSGAQPKTAAGATMAPLCNPRTVPMTTARPSRRRGRSDSAAPPAPLCSARSRPDGIRRARRGHARGVLRGVTMAGAHARVSVTWPRLDEG